MENITTNNNHHGWCRIQPQIEQHYKGFFVGEVDDTSGKARGSTKAEGWV
jgi:hypothetical protein